MRLRSGKLPFLAAKMIFFTIRPAERPAGNFDLRNKALRFALVAT
jgi:hypothetical protein